MEINDTFGARLRAFIEAIGENLSSFGRKMDLKPSQVSDYVSGRIAPGLEVLTKFSERSGASIDWLATGKGSMFRSDAVVPSGVLLTSALSRWTEWTKEDIDYFQSFVWMFQSELWRINRSRWDAIRTAIVEEITRPEKPPDTEVEDGVRLRMVNAGVDVPLGPDLETVEDGVRRRMASAGVDVPPDPDLNNSTKKSNKRKKPK